MMKLITLLSVLFSFSLVSLSQDCGCDYLVETTDDIFDGTSVLPGQTVCLEGGERSELRLENLEGSFLNPIQIKNCGGVVSIDGIAADYGIKFQACNYVQISGSGEDGIDLGIHIEGTSGYGLHFFDLSNHFKVDHVLIENTGRAAVMSRDDPRCDLTANEGTFELQDCHLSNLSILNCGNGIVMGHPLYRYGILDDACGPLFPYGISNLLIENCEITNVLGNGITLYGSNAIIRNNHIQETNISGIKVSMESDVLIEKNKISNTDLYGVNAEKGGFFQIYNNVFEDNGAIGSGAVKVEFYTAEGGVDHNELTFMHNTLVNSGTYNLVIENTESASDESRIENNIFVEPYVIAPDLFEFAPYLSFDLSDLVVVSTNTYSATAEGQNFVDAEAGDYRLTHESPAVNYGVANDLTTDYVNQHRDLAGAPDAGAFEYVPEPIAYFERIPLVGLYVNDFKFILGDEDAETDLLEFAQDNGFNYLVFYNLSYINTHKYDLTDPDEAIVLANFIQRAKEDYGIAQVAAVGEKNASFDKIEVFNSLFGDSWFQKIDVLNLEFEFWTDVLGDVFAYYCENYLEPGGYPCTNAGAFDFYSDQLELIDERAHEMGIISEIYLGYTSDDESIALAERVDRILLHHYRTNHVYGDGSSIYNYHTYRIRAIALSERKPAVMPIFSSRSYHMGPWLIDHSLHEAMETWLYGVEGYYDDDAEGVSDLPISGNIWYRYTSFLEIGGGPHSPIKEDSGEARPDIKISQNFERPEVIIALELEQYPIDNYAQIHNLQGDLILEILLSEKLNRIAINQLNAGIYICSVVNVNGIQKTEKIIQP
ncbi:MAG: hypothetical protein GQ574_05055 [Crocinitomix sp.]|nr:hypothetical protein [Crocinitomix sp.]